MIRSSRSGAPSVSTICTRLSQREAKHDSGVLICKKFPTMNAVRSDGALKIGAHPVGAVFFSCGAWRLKMHTVHNSHRGEDQAVVIVVVVVVAVVVVVVVVALVLLSFF